MDRATLTNAPREFALGGRTFLVTSLTEAEKGQLQAWLKARHPGPLGALDDATLARFGPANRRALIDAAVAQARSWPPRVGSQAWWDAMDTVEGGGAKFLHLVLSRANPFSEAEAAELNRTLELDEFLPLMAHAMGYELPPKAEGATGTAEASPAGNPTPA
jgi:hypothetical protein